MVAHEAGVDLETARALVKVGDAIRNLNGAPLREVASTRTADPGRRARRRRAQPAQRSPVGHRPDPLRRPRRRPRPRRARRRRRPPAVTASDSGSPDRFRFLATFLAGRPLGVTEARAGEAAHTDGRFVFVSAGRSVSEQRREVLVQAALLGAGSLDHGLVRALRGRPKVARRYLALEGRRVLAELAARIPLAAALRPDGEPTTSTADESLEVARGRSTVADPPEWFGVIRPSRLLGAPAGGPSARPSDNDLRLEFEPTDVPEAETTETGSRARRARSSSCSRTRSSTRTPSRTSSTSCSAAPVPPVTGLPAVRCRFGRSGGWTAWGRTPGLSPSRSASPVTARPALPLAWVAPSTRSGTYTTTGTGRSGAGSSTSR